MSINRIQEMSAEVAKETPRRTLKTPDAARYLGISASLLRKMRMRAPDDPLSQGPEYIQISSSLILYEISSLDKWLDSHQKQS